MTPPTQTDPTAELIAERIKHALDLQASEIKALQTALNGLRQDSDDHEARIRSLTETSTQFKLLVALSTGGGLLGLISLLRALIP